MKIGRACQGPVQIDLITVVSLIRPSGGGGGVVGSGNLENLGMFILRMGDQILMKLDI